MSALVVDTSVWIDFFRGKPAPDIERALAHGLVLLSPIVCAELLSAPLSARKHQQLTSFLHDLPLHPSTFEHWVRVGELRSKLARKGLSVSTPDAEVAQCALETGGVLWSCDAVFRKIGKLVPLRLHDAG